MVWKKFKSQVPLGSLSNKRVSPPICKLNCVTGEDTWQACERVHQGQSQDWELSVEARARHLKPVATL